MMRLRIYTISLLLHTIAANARDFGHVTRLPVISSSKVVHIRGGAQDAVLQPPSFKVTQYDAGRLHRWGFLKEWGPTIFSSKFLWIQCASVLAIAACTCHVTLSNQSAGQSKLVGLSEGLEDALHALIIFLLGLFLSEVIARWWALVFDCLGGLTDACHGTVVLSMALLPRDAQAHRRLARWGTLSVALLFEQARKVCASESVPRLLARGLLTPEEAELLVTAELANRPLDPRIPWVWISQFWADPSTVRALEGKSTSLPLLMEQSLKGVSKIGDASGYLGMSLPLPYVHLLTIMAKFQMVFMAMTRGAAIAMNIHDTESGRANQMIEVALDVIRLVVIPILYQGCFDMHAILDNPFGNDLVDLSLRETEDALKSELGDFIYAGSTGAQNRK